jgi:hypothetical protein
MYGELRKYLFLHHELNMPGIGTLRLEREPASIDVANRQINPPSYRLAFDETNSQPSRRFFDCLSSALAIPDREAIMRYNNFVFDLRERIQKGETLLWEGIGEWKKALGSGIAFTPAFDQMPDGEPVPAERVLREKAEHQVRVGESERTADEMREYFQAAPIKKDIYWAVALVLLVILVILIGFYFSSKGVVVEAIGNGAKP